MTDPRSVPVDPYRATPQLRYLRDTNGDHRLEQYFEKPPMMGFAGPVPAHGEWRPVPVTEAQKP